MNDVENEILQCIEEYLKEYADEYQRIVVERGMFGDSIEFTAGYDFMKELMNYIKKQEQEIERLNKELEVTTTNEETFRLEMQEITKILGLDEHTIFDEVKEYARNLVKDNEMYSQLKDTNEEELRQEIDENYKLSELWLQSQNEVKRLNNIINELEKYCNEVIEETKTFTNTWDRAERKAIEQVLNKLKELKENK